MSIFRRLAERTIGHSGARLRELDEEIESHLEMRAEELMGKGMPPDEAKAEALRRFGDLQEARTRLYRSAKHRDASLFLHSLWDNLKRDLVLALRKARRSPGFTVLEIVTIAVGVALTTAVFTLVDRVLLRPLPFPDPQRIVALKSVDSKGNAFHLTSSDNWLDWKEGSRSLETTAIARHPSRVPILIGGERSYFTIRRVSGAFFEVLRPSMLTGRYFTAAEVESGESIVVVSEGFWRGNLGAPVELGQSLEISGRSYSVVGVVPSKQAYPYDTDIWIPGRIRGLGNEYRNNINYSAIARLGQGITREQAQEELSSIARRIRLSAPDAVYSYAVEVSSLREVVVGNDAPRYLWLLMATVIFVLLVASANLAGLNLARAVSGLQETAVRIALGAAGRRLVQQLLTRHCLIGLAGGGLGVALAWWSAEAMVAAAGVDLPRSAEVGIDGRIAAVGIAVSLMTGLLSGLIPALQASSTPFRAALTAGMGATWSSRNRAGRLLVSLEVALSVLLVIGSGLLVRSFQTLLDRDLGFDPSGVVAAEVLLDDGKYDDPGLRTRFWSEMNERLLSVPGVGAAGLANYVPTLGSSSSFIEVEGREQAGGGAGYRIVGEGYFSALGIPLLAGRSFTPDDRMGAERVALINRATAEREWPGQSPIGKRVKAVSWERSFQGEPAPWLRVVGVVGNVRHWGFDSAPSAEMFVTYRQVPRLTRTMTVVARSGRLTPRQLALSVRRTASEVDPEVAADPVLLTEEVGRLLGQRRLMMLVLSGFGVMALALSALGVHGITSFAATRRRHEIGLRISIGARPRDILSLMLADSMKPAALGILAGLTAAWAFRNVLETFLVDVSTGDLTAYLSSILLLVAVTALAALLPAWRASGIDPIRALRTT